MDRSTGRLTRHGYAFGSHYDPDRLGFGPILCHDEHLIGTGQGFEEHPHTGLEIVTWVASGSVVHRDSEGNEAVLGPGEIGVLSAGTGVRHSELAGQDGPARFVQVWLRPDDPEAGPRYSTAPAVAAPGKGLVRMVGEGAALQVGTAGASYDVARLAPGEPVTLPAAGRVHLFLASGALLRSSLAEPLQAGDGFELVDEPAHQVTAAVPTELLVWSFG